MKAVNSSSYSSSSVVNVMIPQFQKLLPLETSLSGGWVNNGYSSESFTTSNKLLSPPVSITPSSICTDLSESEYQPIDLSLSGKYSISSPPLSNTKSESIDSFDFVSPLLKQESTMIIPNHEKNLSEKTNKSSFKTTKQCSNFTIEHLLSSSSGLSKYHFLALPYKQINSIFTKKKTVHFSDHYLHQIIHHRKRYKQEKKSYLSQYSNQPRGVFIRYISDLCNDLVKQQNHQINNRENIFSIDALEQLAELACKLDTRHKKSLLNEEILTSKDKQLLLKQCHLLIKRIYQKNSHKQTPKRLYYNSKLNFKKRILHFLLSILNILQRKKNILLHESNHSDCHIFLSDIRKISIENIKSICFHLKPDQIVSNLEILLPHNGLLYEAIIQPIDDNNELLLVRLHHERQTYLIPIHDLCRLACPKMIPDDVNILSKGSRVCAYWSTSLRGLHPAMVKRIPTETNELSMVSLAFDDGDTGLIKLDEIRLLPDVYDVKGVDLEEWRVSSFQIPSSSTTTRRTSRRVSSSADTNSFAKRVKKEKTSSSSSIVVPQWTLNNRNSTICRHDNKEILHVGDCVVLHGADKSLSYIGKVLKFYHNRLTQQDMVRLKWYYSPQETPVGLHENDLPGALYESTHIDENLIATIRSKGIIYGSYDDYIKKTDDGKKRKETDFYLVGRYNPSSGELQRFDDK